MIMEFEHIILSLIILARITLSGRIAKALAFEISKETCVSEDERTSQSEIRSISVCASICLADQTCEAVTYISKSKVCHLSDDNNLHNCTLQKGDGSINNAKPKICPVGQSHCNIDAGVYYEFSSTTANWDNAKLACQSNGGELASLDTQEKFDWMYARRAAQPNSDPIYTQKMWIGIRYSTAAGGWIWTNGETLNYDEWFPGEPNGGTSDGNRAEYLNVANSCRFNDAHGQTAFYYICEYQL